MTVHVVVEWRFRSMHIAFFIHSISEWNVIFSLLYFVASKSSIEIAVAYKNKFFVHIITIKIIVIHPGISSWSVISVLLQQCKRNKFFNNIYGKFIYECFYCRTTRNNVAVQEIRLSEQWMSEKNPHQQKVQYNKDKQ